jgi:hypothetical protein
MLDAPTVPGKPKTAAGEPAPRWRGQRLAMVAAALTTFIDAPIAFDSPHPPLYGGFVGISTKSLDTKQAVLYMFRMKMRFTDER